MIFRVPIALTRDTNRAKANFMIIGETHSFDTVEEDAQITMKASEKAVAGILSSTSASFRRELMNELENLFPPDDNMFNNRIDEYRKHARNYAVNPKEEDDE